MHVFIDSLFRELINLIDSHLLKCEKKPKDRKRFDCSIGFYLTFNKGRNIPESMIMTYLPKQKMTSFNLHPMSAAV